MIAVKNNIKNCIIITLVGLLISGCTDDSPLISDQDLIVVWAYIYGGEQQVKVKLTSTLPLDADTSLAPPINDAYVCLIKDGQRFDFQPAPGDSGYYQYAGDSLAINTFDEFSIEVVRNEQLVAASTIVPVQPDNVLLNSETLSVPNFDDWAGMQEWRESEEHEIIVNWDSVEDGWFYVTLTNIEENPVAFDFEFKGQGPVDFVFPPIADNQFNIRLPHITHLGRHRVTVYRVNQEYVDLYESREQDSRDLNEPLTNINNGLGIFTAFNSDSTFIDVILAN